MCGSPPPTACWSRPALRQAQDTSTSLSSNRRWYTSSTSSMAQTNSALALAGMHQLSFNQGLNRFFQTPAHRLRADAIYDLTFHQSVSQQMQRPAGPPSGAGSRPRPSVGPRPPCPVSSDGGSAAPCGPEPWPSPPTRSGAAPAPPWRHPPSGPGLYPGPASPRRPDSRR